MMEMRRVVAVLFIALLTVVPAAAQLEIAGVNATATTVRAGSSTNLIVTLRNKGSENVYGIRVSAEIYPQTAYLTSTPTYLDKMEGGKEARVNLPLYVSKDAGADTYSVRVIARYGPLLEDYADSYTTITVAKPSTLDIEGGNVTRVEPGEPFTVRLKVKNVGIGILYDIGLYVGYQIAEQRPVEIGERISPEQLSPIPVGGAIGGGTPPQRWLVPVEIPFYPAPGEDFIATIDELKPGEERYVEFRMIASRDVKESPYVIPLSVKYIVEKSVEVQTQQNAIGVVVGGKPNLVISDVRTDPSRVEEDSAFTLSLQVENVGKGDAKSVKTYVDGHVDFLGTIKMGDVGSGIFDLKAGKSGTQKFNVTITYTDSDGNEYMSNETISIMVHEKSPTAIIGGGVAAAFLLLLFIYWRRRKVAEE